MVPTLTPREFQAKWRWAGLKERTSEHEHFINLWHQEGHSTPTGVNSSGQTFGFHFDYE